MTDRSGRVPDHVPHPDRSRRSHDGGQVEPRTTLQADGGREERPRLLGPDGRPPPRIVHGLGFRAAMIHEEG